MKRSVYDLNFTLIDTRNPEAQTSLCESAYKFWKNSWEETFSSLRANEKTRLRSDDFLDREMTTLSFEGQPVALFFNNWMDLSRNSIINHSYFKNYPEQVIQMLREKGFTRVMTLAYMTLHPEWRTRLTDLPIPDLLFSLSMKRFQETQDEALIGYIRRDKSFSDSFYRHGAEKLYTHEAYNVEVDFCYLTQETAHLSTAPGVADAAEYLWNEYKNQNVPKRKVA